jgi:hypothetical protein
MNAWIEPDGYRRSIAGKRHAFEDQADKEAARAQARGSLNERNPSGVSIQRACRSTRVAISLQQYYFRLRRKNPSMGRSIPMLATAAKLALVAAMLALFATGADAQRGHSRCAKTKDPVKCTCLTANGGRFDRMPGATRYKIYMYSMADIDRYLACMRRHGRGDG